MSSLPQLFHRFGLHRRALTHLSLRWCPQNAQQSWLLHFSAGQCPILAPETRESDDGGRRKPNGSLAALLMACLAARSRPTGWRSATCKFRRACLPCAPELTPLSTVSCASWWQLCGLRWPRRHAQCRCALPAVDEDRGHGGRVGAPRLLRSPGLLQGCLPGDHEEVRACASSAATLQPHRTGSLRWCLLRARACVNDHAAAQVASQTDFVL